MSTATGSPTQSSTGMKGYYALIQYCPDPSRAEVANVGVLLFCPEREFIQAKTAVSNGRIARIFGREGFDPDRVKAMKRFIEDRLRIEQARFKTLDDLHQFIEARGNDLVIGQPRPMKVFDPATDLDELFTELVGGKARTPEKHREFMDQVDHVFRRPSLQGRVRMNERITMPVIGRTLQYRYAFNNGVLNLVRPTLFSANEQKASDMALKLGGEGEMLQRHLKNRLVVICGFEGADGQSPLPGRLQELLREYAVKPVMEGELEEYATEVEHQAH